MSRGRFETQEIGRIGTENEEVFIKWLLHCDDVAKVLDFRRKSENEKLKLSERIDVDFGIETIDGKYILAELKGDRSVCELGNLLFETHRIHHHVESHFYLGWGWRSPAQKLVVRNFLNGETFVFDFKALRECVSEFIRKNAERRESHKTKNLIAIVRTHSNSTTFNQLIPFSFIKSYGLKYQKFYIDSNGDSFSK